MKEIRFEWDENKNRANRSKHGVDFKEARSVFHDDSALEFFDPDHSSDENRFFMIGLSSKARLLLVNYRVKDLEESDMIRIFSSRRATKSEQQHYIEVNR